MISTKPAFRFFVLVLLATAAHAQSPPAAEASAPAVPLFQRTTSFLDPGTGAWTALDSWDLGTGAIDDRAGVAIAMQALLEPVGASLLLAGPNVGEDIGAIVSKGVLGFTPTQDRRAMFPFCFHAFQRSATAQ